MKYFQGSVYIFEMDTKHPIRPAIVKDLKDIYEGGLASDNIEQIIVITWLKMASDGTYNPKSEKWEVKAW